MFFVYILKSETYFNKIYIGYTQNLNERFQKHNSGGCIFTSKFKPWKLVTYTAFSNQKKALEFEKYLKSCSGRALIAKRLL